MFESNACIITFLTTLCVDASHQSLDTIEHRYRQVTTIRLATYTTFTCSFYFFILNVRMTIEATWNATKYRSFYFLKRLIVTRLLCSIDMMCINVLHPFFVVIFWSCCWTQKVVLLIHGGVNPTDGKKLMWHTAINAQNLSVWEDALAIKKMPRF